MEICDVGKILIPTIRLLFYVGYQSRGNFDQVCAITSLTKDQVIETRCFNTSVALDYLFDIKNGIPVDPLPDLFKNKMVQIDLFGIDEEGLPTGLSHIMHLFSVNNNWFLMDSYIGCRGFRCQQVKIEELMSILLSLEDGYTAEDWYYLTGCEPNDTPDSVVSSYFASDFTNNIKDRFKRLLDTVESGTRLGNVGDFDFLNVKTTDELLGYIEAMRDI